MAERTGALTAEAVQARLDAKRRSLTTRSSESETGTRGSIDLVTESAVCPTERCSTTVQWAYRTLPNSRRFPHQPPTCDECQERAQHEEHDRKLAADMERDREARRTRRAEMLDLLQAVGVNTREHGRVTLDEWDTSESGTEPVEACRRFIGDTLRAGAHDPVRGLLLVGTMGNGKTQLAVSTIRELLLDPEWQRNHVVFDNATSLMGELQDTYSGEGSALAIKRRRTSARVWVLDDLGSERPREDPARLLYEILNARALAPTIITSNHTPADIEKRHPEFARVVSRLGSAYFEGVRVQGADRRYRRAG